MEVSALRKSSSNKVSEQLTSKKSKRILHIKSLPVESYQSVRRYSHPKVDNFPKD